MDHLSRIGIFVEVVKQGGFAGAAAKLGLTGSAVSKQIQNLEYDLKVKLLHRTTRKVSVTEEGAILFERSSHALEDLKETISHIHDMKAHPFGSLKISVPVSFGIKYLAKPIAEFAVTYPDVHLDVHFDDRAVDLVEENIDVAIRIGTLQNSSLIARKLGDCPKYVCASPDYLQKFGTPATPEDLKNHNVLAYTRNKSAHEWRYKDATGQLGQVSLNGTFKCDNGNMECEAAIAGIGIAILPYFLIKESLDSGQLQPVLTDYTSFPELNIYALFQPNRYLSTRLRLFVNHIATVIDNQIQHCKESRA